MIDSWQWHGDQLMIGDPDWVAEATEPAVTGPLGDTGIGIYPMAMIVHTARGKLRARPEDWIVKYPSGDIALLTPEVYASLRHGL